MVMAELSTLSTNDVRTEVFSGDRLAVALERWRALEARIGFQNWSCSADWVEAYVEHYGDFADIEVVVVSGVGEGHDREDIGAGMLCQKNLSKLGPLGFQALLNGTGGEPDGDPFYCEHHQLLAAADSYAVVEESVTKRALARAGVDAVYWSGYDEPHVVSLLEREPRADVTEFTHQAIPLAYLIAPKFPGQWIDDADEAQQHIGRLIEWNRPYWGEVHEGSSRRGQYAGRYERFLRDVTTRLIDAGRAAIVATDAGAVVLFFGGADASTVLAYADGAAHVTAMKQAHLAAAHLASERGFDRYDFAVASADGTEDLGTVQRPVLWVRIPQSTWRSRLLFGLSRLKQRVRG